MPPDKTYRCRHCLTIEPTVWGWFSTPEKYSIEDISIRPDSTIDFLWGGPTGDYDIPLDDDIFVCHECDAEENDIDDLLEPIPGTFPGRFPTTITQSRSFKPLS